MKKARMAKAENEAARKRRGQNDKKEKEDA